VVVVAKIPNGGVGSEPPLLAINPGTIGIMESGLLTRPSYLDPSKLESQQTQLHVVLFQALLIDSPQFLLLQKLLQLVLLMLPVFLVVL
jgi:hypothetical protein